MSTKDRKLMCKINWLFAAGLPHANHLCVNYMPLGCVLICFKSCRGDPVGARTEIKHSAIDLGPSKKPSPWVIASPTSKQVFVPNVLIKIECKELFTILATGVAWQLTFCCRVARCAGLCLREGLFEVQFMKVNFLFQTETFEIQHLILTSCIEGRRESV